MTTAAYLSCPICKRNPGLRRTPQFNEASLHGHLDHFHKRVDIYNLIDIAKTEAK
jgi:hypothetical protein